MSEDLSKPCDIPLSTEQWSVWEVLHYLYNCEFEHAKHITYHVISHLIKQIAPHKGSDSHL